MSSTLTLTRTLIFALLLMACCAHRAMSRSLPFNESNSVQHKFEQWMAKHNRTYRNDDAIKAKRFNIFKQNLEYISEFNAAGKQTYQLGLNAFADMTSEEFLASHTGLKLPIASLQESAANTTFRYDELSEVPGSMDWRAKGAVTPVKHQEGCGACWAFSAVAAIESITKIKTGRLVRLSEQQVVDCSTDSGCSGHWMNDAFQYVIQNKGINAETDYRRYSATAETCRVKSLPAAQITSYEKVPSNNEAALLKAVAMQPVSVCVDSRGRDFQWYKGGVFDAADCGTATSHAVAIVGYGTSEEGTKYWLLKNSWGTTWGENGYMRILRDAGPPEGLCGIARVASYPIV